MSDGREEFELEEDKEEKNRRYGEKRSKRKV